jgi:acetoin utilization protein AcuB
MKMRVRDFMSTNVIVVDENTLIYQAKEIMKAHKIRRLPVMKKDKLVGLVTERMLLEASPSEATSLSIYEVNYILSKMTVKKIMVKNPDTIPPDMPAEMALQLGQEKGYGAFPIVEDGKLVGIATESDIVRFMTKVLGVREKGKRIDIMVQRKSGNMQNIMKILDKNKTLLLSLLTLPPDEEKDDWLVVLRLEIEDVDPVVKDLKSAGFNVTYAG